MKRHCGKCGKLGLAAIALGLLVILALLLPAGFWIAAAGVVLIVVGICMIRR